MRIHAYLSLLAQKARALPRSSTHPLERLLQDPDIREYVSRFRKQLQAEAVKPSRPTGSIAIDVPASSLSPEEQRSTLKIAAHVALRSRGLRLRGFQLTEKTPAEGASSTRAEQCVIRFARAP